MTIDECKSCKNHVLFKDGYVLCNYFDKVEQRVAGAGEDHIIRILSCPKEEAAKEYKKLFPARWNKPREDEGE